MFKRQIQSLVYQSSKILLGRQGVCLVRKQYQDILGRGMSRYGISSTQKSQQQQQYTYDHLSIQFFKKVQESVIFLNTLDSEMLERCIEQTYQNIFPYNRRMMIPQKINEILEEQNNKRYYTAQDIFQCIKHVIEFLDKGNKGFLTGDLDTYVIHQISKSLPILISNLEQNYQKVGEAQQQQDQIITEYYETLRQQICAGLFKLPKKGIIFPDFENPRNLFERQLLLEDETNEIAVEKFMNVYEDLQEMGLSVNLKFAKEYIVTWFPQLCKAIRDEQDQCILGNLKGDRKLYGNYLVKISAEKIALISLGELMKNILKLSQRNKKAEDNGSGTSSPNYHIISKGLFEAIGKALNAQIFFEYEEEMVKERQQQIVQGRIESSNDTKKLSERIIRKKLDTNKLQDIGYPKEVQVKLGSLLVYLMKETIKFKTQDDFWQNLLTISHAKIKGKKQYVGVLNINEEFILTLLDKIHKKDSLFIQLDRCLPMIYRPAEWQDYEIGGYYQKPTNVMRIQESQMQERSIKYANLSGVYRVLDILGQLPWRINKKVLNVVEELWEQGGGSGEIPLKFYDYDDYVYSYQFKECFNYEEKQKILKKMQDQKDIHSLRCDFTLKLNVAKAFSSIDKIYFPHNVDFRGRVYPIPPHLNHMSSDICRGLLEFSEGKPIGQNGISWLKIHLANVMGKDKLSFSERIKYVDDNMQLIQACAHDPLKNRQWLEYEDCWQSLAAIIDLCEALKCEQPEKYISRLHIHQDGSCNGLQHYAALGRDYAGAVQVNLAKSEKPGDVYTHVANMVSERINQEALNTQSKFCQIANKLIGNIKRKTVKQTVMTSVYGVTFTGARAQIYKQLKGKEFLDNEKETYEASYLVALLTLDCIKHLFSGAHEIKKWLIQCANLIANTQNPVSWITPLGLPVVQPYRNKSHMDIIQTIIQKVTVTPDNDLLPINRSKQRSAFPPNYIHSLDSTHMMYTAIECEKRGITFAAVHDSYWTHACDIDHMNKILREQFVRLHSQPLLEELKQSFETRYPYVEFPPIPQRGEFSLSEVLNSEYFFA